MCSRNAACRRHAHRHLGMRVEVDVAIESFNAFATAKLPRLARSSSTCPHSTAIEQMQRCLRRIRGVAILHAALPQLVPFLVALSLPVAFT